MMNRVCKVCGNVEESGIALMGACDEVGTCPDCGMKVYGMSARPACPNCGTKSGSGKAWERRKIEDGEKLLETGVCQTCQDMMKQGIVFVDVRGSSDAAGTAPLVRTGRFAVIREDAVRRFMKDPLLQDVLKARVCQVPEDVWESLGLDDLMPEEEKTGNE